MYPHSKRVIYTLRAACRTYINKLNDRNLDTVLNILKFPLIIFITFINKNFKIYDAGFIAKLANRLLFPGP